MRDARPESDERNVLEFDHSVRAYPPAKLGGYWRMRWEEKRKRKDTTAPNRGPAIAKASELVERLGRSAPTELGRASGADLVAITWTRADARRG